MSGEKWKCVWYYSFVNGFWGSIFCLKKVFLMFLGVLCFRLFSVNAKMISLFEYIIIV
jgi:hypothetical protein